MTSNKNKPVHRDKLGVELNVGDYVCYPSQNSLSIGEVIKLNNKMVKVAAVPTRKYSPTSNKYSADMIKLNSADVTFYVLVNAGK